MRTLTFTTLYPNSQQPHHGIFVEQRLRHLVASGEVETEVIAPVPWFPFRNGSFGIYGRYASVPAEERRHDIRITHPRFPVIPKLGMSLAPLLLVKGVNTHVRDKMREGFDLIDAHYFYPDGVAAAWFGRKLGMPVVITARGTDVNLIPRYTWPRRMMLWAAKYCSRVITVSEALRSRLIELGVPERRVITLRNGVDLAFFRPSVDREALRRELGMCRPILLSVGHLIERKGHHIAIRAMTELKDYDLIIAGDGEMEADLRRLAQTLEVDDRVRFAGALTQEQLREFYAAADALVLASSREGMANVLLESIACGTPVVATAVWGTPEVVATAEAGMLMKERTPEALVDAVRRLFSAYPDRKLTRSYAQGFDWVPTTRGQIDIFEQAIAGGA